MTYPLISRAKLSKFVNVKADNTTYDEVLEAFAILATELFEEYTQREFEYQSKVEFAASSTGPIGDPLPQIIWLSGFPIDTDIPVEVSYSTSLDWDNGKFLTVGAECQLDYKTGVMRIFSMNSLSVLYQVGFEENQLGFRVKYSAGYEVVTPTTPEVGWDYLGVPPGLETAAGMQIAFLFNAFTRGSIGVETISGDSKGAKKTKSTPASERESLVPEVKLALKPYVRKGPLIGRSE